MNDHQLLFKEIGTTYIHPSGNASSAIDYILYDKNNKDNTLNINRLESTTNVSDLRALYASSNSDLFSGCFRFTVNISSNMDLYFSLSILFQLILFEFTVDGVKTTKTIH
jgi:hypothetical protein